MKSRSTSAFALRLCGWAGSGLLAVALAACGGSSGDPCGLNVNCAAPTATGGGNGTVPTTVPVAADLSLALSSSTLLNSGSDAVVARVVAVDANRNLLADVPVTLSVDNHATVAVPARVTDSKGELSATVAIGADRSNRVITVTATASGLTRSASIQVTGARVAATALPATVAPGAAGAVRFRVTDAGSNPIAQQAIVVSGIGGVETSARTDANGEYLYSYTAPTATGTVNVSASSAGVSATQALLVQTASAVAPADSSPPVESASVSVSSSVVPLNSGATANQVEVRALVLRDTNRPAERVRVRFDLDGNVNNVRGAFSTGTSLIYTDASGIARSSYVPGDRSSPLDGVTIRACWDYVDFAVGTCPNAARTTLTVVAEPLSVSVGTDNKIALGPTGIDYQKSYLIQVNDASGAPKGDVPLTATVDLLGYATGRWSLAPNGLDWRQTLVGSFCENEDLNRNGVNETYANGAVEDANRNGQLDPRRADVLISIANNARTNAAGQAVLQLNFPQSVASWVTFRVTVNAGGTGGTEGRASFDGVLPVLDEHVTSQDRVKPPPPPAFVISPYGVTGMSSVNVVNPDGKSGMLCQR